MGTNKLGSVVTVDGAGGGQPLAELRPPSIVAATNDDAEPHRPISGPHPNPSYDGSAQSAFIIQFLNMICYHFPPGPPAMLPTALFNHEDFAVASGT